MSDPQIQAQIERLNKKLNDLIEILSREGTKNLSLSMKARGHN